MTGWSSFDGDASEAVAGSLLGSLARLDKGVYGLAAASGIEIDHVSKVYERRTKTETLVTWALDNVSFSVNPNSFVSLIGPSGCGKTTLLRIAAGLVSPTEGQIVIDGEPVTGPGPDRAMVFQMIGLFPWRTVIDNVELGLELEGVPPSERRERASTQIKMMGLTRFASHYPWELSGGMQQRVGIARALVRNPKTLLMDEPFGALDALTRTKLQDELLHIWERDRKTVLFVTHSVDEALLLSDRIVVMTKSAQIRRVIDVPLERPRVLMELVFDPRFSALKRQLMDDLRDGDEEVIECRSE